MEARRAVHTSGVSKHSVLLIAAMLAAVMLGFAGGYVAKALSIPLAAPVAAPVAHILPGQGLATGDGTAWNYSTRHAGNQAIDGPASGVPVGPAFKAPGLRRDGPQF